MGSVKEKVCKTQTCKKCDNYVVANRDKQKYKVDRAYQFCSRVLSLEDCCNKVALGLGFVSGQCVKVECEDSRCGQDRVEPTVQGEEIFSDADFDNYKVECRKSQNCTMGEIGTVFSDVDNCVDEMEADDRSFIEKKAPLFLILTLSALVLLSIGTFTLMKYHRQQLQKIREYRQGYGTTETEQKD